MIEIIQNKSPLTTINSGITLHLIVVSGTLILLVLISIDL